MATQTKSISEVGQLANPTQNTELLCLNGGGGVNRLSVNNLQKAIDPLQIGAMKCTLFSLPKGSVKVIRTDNTSVMRVALFGVLYGAYASASLCGHDQFTGTSSISKIVIGSSAKIGKPSIKPNNYALSCAVECRADYGADCLVECIHNIIVEDYDENKHGTINWLT